MGLALENLQGFANVVEWYPWLSHFGYSLSELSVFPVTVSQTSPRQLVYCSADPDPLLPAHHLNGPSHVVVEFDSCPHPISVTR